MTFEFCPYSFQYIKRIKCYKGKTHQFSIFNYFEYTLMNQELKYFMIGLYLVMYTFC